MKRLFIIDTYPSDEKDKNILKRCIESIKPLGYDILIVSHLPIDTDIASSVNYVIYDFNNTFLIAHYTPFWWMNQPSFRVQINNAGHTLPICRNMNTSINMAKCLGYDEFIFMESDIVFGETDLNILKNILDGAFISNGKKMLFFRPEEYRDCEGSYVYETLLFAGKPDFFLETFTPPLDLEQWLAIPMGYTLELSFYERFSHRESEFHLVKDHSSNIFKQSKINLSRYGLFNCDVVFNESSPEEPVLFIMNSLIETEPKRIEVYINDNLAYTFILHKSQYWFNSYKFDGSEIMVYVFDEGETPHLFMKRKFVLNQQNSETFKEKGTIKFQ